MTTFAELLNDIAGEAKEYDGTERALTVARRRRRLDRLAPVAAAVVLMVGVAAVWLPLRTGPADEPGDWLPAELVVPQHEPPALPKDRGVQPAVLAYAPAGRGVSLLTVDGGHYLVIPAGDEDAQLVGISPDGRWLLCVRGGRLVLRDLTSTTETSWPIPVMAVSAHWSPDSRNVAVQGRGEPVATEVDGKRIRGFVGGPRPEVTMIDLETLDSRTVSVTAIPEAEVFALSDTGDLAVRGAIGRSTTLQVWLVDGASGAPRRHLDTDLTPWLTERERQTDQMLTSGQLRADGRTLLVRPLVPLPGGGAVSDDVLAVDIESGRVTRRYALPDPVQAPDVVDPDGSRTMSLKDSRQVVAVVPGGLLLQHRSGAEPRPARQLELLDTRTGELRPRTKLPADVGLLAVRG